MDRGPPPPQHSAMRILLFAAGILTCLLGIAAFKMSGDPSLLQGGLTLGGGWIICGLFSLGAKWHGIAGAGMLALLGAARSLPALPKVPAALAQGEAGVLLQAASAAISMVVFLASTRALLVERNRRNLERLKQ